MYGIDEALRTVAQHYDITEEEAHNVLLAAAEGRVKISRKYKDETCGTCDNFDRTPCKASGVCTVRCYVGRYIGETDIPLKVSQSRPCCNRYNPKKGSAVSGNTEPVPEQTAEVQG